MNGFEIKGGLAGKILRVDLTRGSIRTEPTEPYARQWIGGRSISSWLKLRAMKKNEG